MLQHLLFLWNIFGFFIKITCQNFFSSVIIILPINKIFFCKTGLLFTNKYIINIKVSTLVFNAELEIQSVSSVRSKAMKVLIYIGVILLVVAVRNNKQYAFLNWCSIILVFFLSGSISSSSPWRWLEGCRNWAIKMYCVQCMRWYRQIRKLCEIWLQLFILRHK